MSTAVASAPPGAAGGWGGRVFWLGLLAVTIGFAHLPRGTLDGLWEEVPRSLQLPLADWISAGMDWLVNDASLGLFTFRDLTRWIAALLALPLEAATALFATGLMRGQGSAAVQLLPPLPWFAVVIAATLVGLHAGGARLAALVGGALLYLAVFGQWQSAMVTLASIAVAVPLGVAGGLVLGIAAYRRRWRRARCSRPSSTPCRPCRSSPISCPSSSSSASARSSALIATVIYAHAADGADHAARAARRRRRRSSSSGAWPARPRASSSGR